MLPSTKLDVASQDPGRFWRRLVRSAVGLFILLLLLNWQIDHVPPWTIYENIARVARGDVLGLGNSQKTISEYFLRAFACFVQPVFFMAPLLTILATPAVTKPGWKRIPLLLVAVVLWFVALIPPYFYGAVQLGVAISNHDNAAVGMGLMSAPLLLGFLAAVSAWRSRHGAQCVFWLGLYPVGSVHFAVACLCIGNWSSGMPSVYLVVPTLGFLFGSILFASWVMWWRAVARNETVASTKVAQEQLETRTAMIRPTVAERVASMPPI